MIKIAPSILSADFSNLEREVQQVQDAGADWLHIDVMDGHFVPNITIGPVVVKDLRKVTRLPLDVHLMIERPERFCDAFLKAGSDMITVHVETVTELKLKKIKAMTVSAAAKLGLSLNPGTPVSALMRLLKYADIVLVMSVNPGFGGQEFIPSALPKIERIRRVFSGDIAVDGGINAETGSQCVTAGANVLAAGSYVFKSKNYAEAIRSLRCAVTERQ